MREIFKYGSVGRAPRERCLYPERNRLEGGLVRPMNRLEDGSSVEGI
jgi:hypothetical protein